MSRVIDFAWGRPSVASLKAAGAIAVCRYLSYDKTGKTLTKAEADGLRLGGIDVVSNWEQAGNWTEYAGGQTTGRSHAAEANRQHIACGGPPERPIYFSTDWNATSTQLGTVAEYYRGVASVIGLNRTGAYGGFTTIKYLFDQGVIAWGWQTYAWSTFRDDPSGQMYLHWDPRAQLRQVQNGVSIGGVDCDLDETRAADFGQWGAGAHPMADTDVPGTYHAAKNGDYWGLDLVTGAQPARFEGADGAVHTTPNVLHAKLDTLLSTTAADLAEAKGAAVAIHALADALSAGGGSVDAAAIIAVIREEGSKASAAADALTAQLVASQIREAELHARLAAALGEGPG